MVKKGGLGRGLDSLIPSSETEKATEGVTMLPLDAIRPNPRQPRSHFDPDELAELAASIQEHGVLQPLLVTQIPNSEDYMLIAGERRLLAARQAGLSMVPVILREATQQEQVILALVENVQRTDLGALEAAQAYRQLNEDFGLSHEDISVMVGKNRTTVTNTLRLLKLPQPVQKALASNEITEGHARALLALATPKAQEAALQSILRHGLNVRQTEELVRRLSGEKPQPKLPAAQPPEVVALEDRLCSHLGTRVNLNRRKKGGTLVIHFYSDEELDALVQHILGEAE